MPHHMVWFDQERFDQAQAHVMPVPAEDCEARGIMGYRQWSSVPMPGIDGIIVNTPASLIMTNFLGSAAISPGKIVACDDGKKRLLNWKWLCDVAQPEPGILVANVRPEFWSEADVANEAKNQDAVEQRCLETALADREAKAQEMGQRIDKSLRSYYEVVAHLMGIKAPERMAGESLKSVFAMAALAKDKGHLELLSEPGEWLQAYEPEAANYVPPPKPGQVPVADFVRVASGALSAAVSTQHVKRKA